MLKHALVSIPLLVAACGTTPSDDSDDITADLTDGGKADSPSSSKMKSGGEIEIGGGPEAFAYTGNPKYGSFTFTGTAGNTVRYVAHAGDHTIKTWLLDNKFNVVIEGNIESRLLSKTGTYYIAFREENEKPANFTVAVTEDNDSNFCWSDDSGEGIRGFPCPTGELCTPNDPDQMDFNCQGPDRYTFCKTDADCKNNPQGEVCVGIANADGSLSTTQAVCTPRG